MQRTNVRRLLVALLAVFALTGWLAACGDDDSGDSSASEGTDGGSGGAPESIRIGYQNIPNADLIVKQQGLLEEALPDTEITWTLFDSGGAVNEAFVAGAIDIGLAGSSPVSRGISNGIEYQVPWIHDVIGDAEALAVNPDSGAESVEDLAGLTIAVPFASTTHFSLLAALDRAGVDPRDVDIIDSEPPEILAAFSRGDIDGTYVWNPTLAEVVDQGGEILVTSAELAAEGDTTYDLAVVSNEFAEAHPEAVQAWVDAQDQAVRQIQDDPEAAAEVIGAELNLTAEEVLPQLEGLIFLNAEEQATAEFLGGGLAENLHAAGVFNQEQGEIDDVASEEDYADSVKEAFAAGVG